MSNFDWQQEDDRWDEPSTPASSTAEKRKRPFILLLVLVALLLLAGWIVFRQANEQIDTVTTTMQTAILAAHNLVQSADETADVELLHSVLSGRLPSWTMAQEEAVAAGVLYGRDPWGLETIPANPVELPDLVESVSLTLSPDLNAAELQFPRMYHTTIPDGIQKTVTLTQTAVYRRGERSWLLAPPLSEYWGSWVTNEGQYLTLVYPQRDDEIAERLAADLEDLLAQICTDPALPPCTATAPYALRLDTSPDSLAVLIDTRAFFEAQPYLNLPSPSLFGLPQDDAGYEVLLRAYAVPLITEVFANLFEWECCQHAPVFQALITKYLSDIGLVNWPVTDAFHARALREGVQLADLMALWRSRDFLPSDEEGWFLYAALDFLLTQYPALSVPDLIHDMADTSTFSFWITNSLNKQGYQIIGGDAGLTDLDNEWWHYAYTQTLLAQENEPPPLPLPAQDALLLCMSDVNFEVSTTMSLVRFNQESAESEELLKTNGVVLFNPMLADDGIIVQTITLNGAEEWLTEIRQFNGQTTILADDAYMTISLGQFDPSGRFAVNFISDSEQSMPLPYLLDLDSCDETTCDALSLAGLPYWSPDGQKTIVENAYISESSIYLRNGSMTMFDAATQPHVNKLWVGDNRGQLSGPITEIEEVGRGYSPFWLDDNTFGYIRLGPSSADEAEVVSQSLTEETAVSLASTTDIQELLQSQDRAPITLRYVMTHPEQPGLLILVALDALARDAYIFSYHVETDELRLELQSSIDPFHSLGFSPNGRWLVLTGLAENELGDTSAIYVHDLTTHETQTYFSETTRIGFSPLYDWSADGNWLIFQIDGRVFSLVAPAYAYQRVQAHEQGICTAAAWINR